MFPSMRLRVRKSAFDDGVVPKDDFLQFVPDSQCYRVQEIGQCKGFKADKLPLQIHMPMSMKPASGLQTFPDPALKI